MQAQPMPLEPGILSKNICPRCVIVTGPMGAGKTRWTRRQIEELQTREIVIRTAVLLAEEGRTSMKTYAREVPAVHVRQLSVSCPCCTALVDLPKSVRDVVATVDPSWMFIEAPSLGAVGFITEFDRMLNLPRQLVVCLNQASSRASRENALSPFQMFLLQIADLVVSDPA